MEAVFSATFSDFKNVKTRSAVQIILEVPVEKADQALAALGGLPKPGNEVWVAVARLQEAQAEPVAQIAPPADEPKTRKPLPQRAGMIINNALFWRYLAECRGAPGIADKDAADRWLKGWLGIESKRDLVGDLDAASRFSELEVMFYDYANRGEWAREYGA